MLRNAARESTASVGKPLFRCRTRWHVASACTFAGSPYSSHEVAIASTSRSQLGPRSSQRGVTARGCEISNQSLFCRQSSTHTQGSNLDLHPVPVDYGLFEDPQSRSLSSSDGSIEAAHIAQDEHCEGIASYVPPSSLSVVEQVLLRDGPSITQSTLSEALLTLQQVQQLHADQSDNFGDAPAIFIRAAYVAFTFGRPREAEQWLAASPALDKIPESAREDAQHTTMKLLIMLKKRASRSPGSLRLALLALISKGWHVDEVFASRLTGCIKDLLHITTRPGDVRQLWREILSASGQIVSESQSRKTEADALQSQRNNDAGRRFLSVVQGAAIRHLAMRRRFEEAMIMFKESLAAAEVARCVPSQSLKTLQDWEGPPVTVFTYRFLLEKLLVSDRGDSLLMAHGCQRELQGVLDQLVSRDDSTLTPKMRAPGVLVNYHDWSSRQARLLQSAGEEVLSEFAEQVPPPSSRPARRKGRETEIVLASDEDIIALSETSQVDEAQSALLQRISQGSALSPGEYRHLPSSRCIASYQAALDNIQGRRIASPAAAFSGPAVDEQVESALREARAGKGLWETAHMWRLGRQHEHEETLRFYTERWHSSPDIPVDLLREALSGPPDRPLQTGDKFASVSASSDDWIATSETASSNLLWPSAHTSNLVLRAIVELLQSGDAVSDSSEVMSSNDQRRLYAEDCLGKLERCYRMWHTSLQELKLSHALDSRRLDSYAFDPWLAALCRQTEKLDALRLRHGPSPRVRKDARALLEDIDILSSNARDESRFAGASRRLDVSATVYRALEILRDMSDLDVRPSVSTWSIVLDAIGRDVAAGPLPESRSLPLSGAERTPSTARTSAAGGHDENPATSWDIIRLLALRLGLKPEATQASSGAEAPQSGSREHARGFGQANVVNYAALLRGLLSVPEYRRDERQKASSGSVTETEPSARPLDAARQVRGWLRDAVEAADRQATSTSTAAPSVREEPTGGSSRKHVSAGIAAHPTGIKRADLVGDAQVVEMLQRLNDALRAEEAQFAQQPSKQQRQHSRQQQPRRRQ